MIETRVRECPASNARGRRPPAPNNAIFLFSRRSPQKLVLRASSLADIRTCMFRRSPSETNDERLPPIAHLFVVVSSSRDSPVPVPIHVQFHPPRVVPERARGVDGGRARHLLSFSRPRRVVEFGPAPAIVALARRGRTEPRKRRLREPRPGRATDGRHGRGDDRRTPRARRLGERDGGRRGGGGLAAAAAASVGVFVLVLLPEGASRGGPKIFSRK